MPLQPYQERRRVAGLCIECGTLPRSKKLYCENCGNRIRRAMLRLYEERKEKGICVDCGVNPKHNRSKSRCKDCLQKKANQTYEKRHRPDRRFRQRGSYIQDDN